MKPIRVTPEPPNSFMAVTDLYEVLNWNSLGLTTEELERMCRQSWYVLYAYEEERLVGMARIVSDGVITAVICGVGVIAQLMCVERLEPYYETLSFKKFSVGMYRELKNR